MTLIRHAAMRLRITITIADDALMPAFDVFTMLALLPPMMRAVDFCFFSRLPYDD